MNQRRPRSPEVRQIPTYPALQHLPRCSPSLLNSWHDPFSNIDLPLMLLLLVDCSSYSYSCSKITHSKITQHAAGQSRRSTRTAVQLYEYGLMSACLTQTGNSSTVLHACVCTTDCMHAD